MWTLRISKHLGTHTCSNMWEICSVRWGLLACGNWCPQNTLRLTSPSSVQGLAPDFQDNGSLKILWYQVLEKERGKHTLPLQITSMMVTFGNIQRTTSVHHKWFSSFSDNSLGASLCSEHLMFWLQQSNTDTVLSIVHSLYSIKAYVVLSHEKYYWGEGSLKFSCINKSWHSPVSNRLHLAG